jgi:hypothetical protein
MYWKALVWIPAAQYLSFLYSFQAVPGAHLASYPMDIEGSFPKRLSDMIMQLNSLNHLVPSLESSRYAPLPQISSWQIA